MTTFFGVQVPIWVPFLWGVLIGFVLRLVYSWWRRK